MTLNPLFPLLAEPPSPDTAQRKSAPGACNETRNCSTCLVAQTVDQQSSPALVATNARLEGTKPSHDAHPVATGHSGANADTVTARIMLGVHAFLALANKQTGMPGGATAVDRGPLCSPAIHNSHNASRVRAVSAHSANKASDRSAANAPPTSCNSSSSSRLTTHDPHSMQQQSNFAPGYQDPGNCLEMGCVQSSLTDLVSAGKLLGQPNICCCQSDGVDKQGITDSASSAHLACPSNNHQSYKPAQDRHGKLHGWMAAVWEDRCQLTRADSCRSGVLPPLRVSGSSSARHAEPQSPRVGAQQYERCPSRHAHAEARPFDIRGTSQSSTDMRQPSTFGATDRGRYGRHAQLLPLGGSADDGRSCQGSETCEFPAAHGGDVGCTRTGKVFGTMAAPQLLENEPTREHSSSQLSSRSSATASELSFGHRACPITAAMIAQSRGPAKRALNMANLQNRGTAGRQRKEPTWQQAYRALRSKRTPNKSKAAPRAHIVESRGTPNQDGLSLCGGQVTVRGASGYKH
jgi:hypothetical protein